MAQLECYTTHSPPTTVVWMRNGDVIDVDDDSVHIVANHRHSHYRNELLVMNVTSIISDNIFTCTINNSRGSISHDIPTNLTGIYIIIPSTEFTLQLT